MNDEKKTKEPEKHKIKLIVSYSKLATEQNIQEGDACECTIIITDIMDRLVSVGMLLKKGWSKKVIVDFVEYLAKTQGVMPKEIKATIDKKEPAQARYFESKTQKDKLGNLKLYILSGDNSLISIMDKDEPKKLGQAAVDNLHLHYKEISRQGFFAKELMSQNQN